MTKRLLRWRGTLMGLAIFFTMLPMSFAFHNHRLTWMFLQDMPPATTSVVCLAAIACWGGFFYVRRRLEVTGL